MNAMRLAGQILAVSLGHLEHNVKGMGERKLSPLFSGTIALATGPADAYKTLGQNLCKKELYYG